jgi:ribosomal protein S18 acetylase RimI-like enzyme
MKPERQVQIINYEAKYQHIFEKLNRQWLEEYFVVEPIDEHVLGNPQNSIIDHGGTILFASADNIIVGTVALKFVERGVLEMTKMAVDISYRGIGVGKLLCQAAIEVAQKQHVSKLILYSSTKLIPALQLYRKMGFIEVPLQPGLYQRADIMMERSIRHQPATVYRPT